MDTKLFKLDDKDLQHKFRDSSKLFKLDGSDLHKFGDTDFYYDATFRHIIDGNRWGWLVLPEKCTDKAQEIFDIFYLKYIDIKEENEECTWLKRVYMAEDLETLLFSESYEQKEKAVRDSAMSESAVTK